jgi:glycosyltransferase involved in cell wall biosynthesis
MATIFMAAYTNYRRDPRVKREAEALVGAGHEVVFLARRQAGEPDRETIAKVTVIKTIGFKRKCRSSMEYMIDYCVFFLMIFLHLLRHPLRYQLIHINNMPDFLVFAACLPRLLGRPVIHDIHDLMPELYMEKFSSADAHWMVKALVIQERWAGRFASAVLTVEDRLKDILTERGIPGEKISVLMNLPDERIFTRRTSPPKPVSAPFVLAYHGTLAHRLGLDVAIRAVAKCRHTIPRLKLHIIGDGEERERLISLRDELELGEIVTFSDGFIPLEKIPVMIEDADVGIVPLRICSGTDIMLPTKLLEYVSFGIPCIVPKTITIMRYFDDEMVQYFEAENIDSLAHAIVELYKNPLKRRELSQQATERFGMVYQWSTHKQVYTHLVAQLLKG